MKYKQDIAFIDRERELGYLANFIDKRPNEILFLHGPKSSGKTTLLYRFFDNMSKLQKLDVKFVNLREILIVSYKMEKWGTLVTRKNGDAGKSEGDSRKMGDF